ncbi:ABC transporter ATP-binding protein/permease [Pseudomonas sp. REP124]|uniref:ABC transporter ATP-binding protein n=1 Tax=Pseudomonas sp. REP124 TaxID=2875731 RepID=UPI001CCA34CF|nr:ABC transporter ATP-binding protein [Pseudomonas sp. REP124]MBZ9781409.1 ABC transporter ATP-binding protein/permease [Pseudomonas sp. REP124]
MNEQFRPYPYSQVLGFVARMWMRRRGFFISGTLLTLAATGFDLLLPWASARLIESVALNTDAPTVWQNWFILLGAFAGFAISRNLAHRLWIPLASRNMQAVLLKSFEHVLSAPAHWHAVQSSGDTLRRLRRSMSGYDKVTDAVTVHLGPALMVLLGLVVMIGWREPLAGLFALLVAIAFIVSNLVVGMQWIRPAHLNANFNDGQLSGLAADVLAAATTIKSFRAETRERARMEEVAQEWGLASSKAWRRVVDLGLMQNLLLLLLLAGLSGVALLAWSKGATRPGDVAFAVTSFLLMAGYLRGFGENLRAAQSGLEDAADALFLTGLPQEESGSSETLAIVDDRRGEVVFDNIGFTYPGTDAPVLEGFSLHVLSGETVAIAGASGSGKSTVSKLLQRFYEPHGGQVMLDGRDISTLPLDVLRRNVSMVGQDAVLLSRSIRDNISYSRPNASLEEIVAAATAACAHEFIMALPEGYNTHVGSYGALLSGGQRQRIALARAVLADAPVLVLDEATSALDTQTEARVLASIVAFRPQQTRIVIAHRPAAILAADRVLWLEQGAAFETAASCVI